MKRWLFLILLLAAVPLLADETEAIAPTPRPPVNSSSSGRTQLFQIVLARRDQRPRGVDRDPEKR